MLFEAPLNGTQMETLLTSLVLNTVGAFLQVERKTQPDALRCGPAATQVQQFRRDAHEQVQQFPFSFSPAFGRPVKWASLIDRLVGPGLFGWRFILF